MPVQCPSCKLLFGTSNELDWHVREEHTRPSLPAMTPPPDDVTTPVGRTEPVTVGTARAGRDSPPPAPDPSEPSAASSAPSGPLAWLRRWLRPSPSSRQPPR
jgi:hypothetical protein